ncbi:MAG: tandem-95 repeat protein [Nitrosopumilus sp.]|nr:tandem-95 repeat protein [Nitrosopumilus sp.]
MQKLSGLFLFAVLISGIFSSSSAFAQIPTAVDDSYSVDEDSLLTVFPDGILFNDSDVGNDFFSIILTNTGFGILALNQNGTFTYQPNENFSSTDSFTYALNNGTHNSNNATVTITVNPINDAPVALDDLAETQQNVPIRIHVLENDSDVEDDSLNIILEVDPSITMGNATLDGSDVLFTPQANFVGKTSFSYRASDGDKTSNLANVTITINPINDTPNAIDDTATTPENTPVIILVLDNDIDDDSLTIDSITQGTNGTVTTNGTIITYTPDTNFNGTDSFTYTISDGVISSNFATVTVNVTAVNDDTDDETDDETDDDTDSTDKKELKKQLKTLKDEYKAKEKELKKQLKTLKDEYKAKEKELKKQLKEFKKDKKSHDDDDDKEHDHKDKKGKGHDKHEDKQKSKGHEKYDDHDDKDDD